MGSCQSTPTKCTPASVSSEPPSFEKTTVSTSASTSTLGNLGSSSSNEKNLHLQSQKNNPIDDYRKEVTGATKGVRNDSSSGADSRYAYFSKTDGESQKEGSMESVRVPLSRPKAGYSSGGSSEEDYKEEYEQEGAKSSPSRKRDQHLAVWKDELMADGDLSKAVVRIETDFGRPIEDVYDGVHDGPILGAGVSGTVRRVKHRSTGVNYACKCLDLGLIVDEQKLEQLREEIFIMCQLDHPNIVRLEEVYESGSEIYLIQELSMGGDLFDRLDEQPDLHYTEAQCARLVKQMLSSVRYLHSKNIIHRDLKLENFLFATTDPDSELKMIDFGLSKHFTHDGEVQHEMVGTPYAVAPEVIRGNYDERCDIWALGVITYLLLCGETPFGGMDGECLLSVRNNILRGSISFEPSDVWEHVSETGKNFVKLLLNPDSNKRPTAREAQRDEWIQVYGKKDSKEGSALSSKIAGALVQFKEYSNMRKLLSEVLSFTLLPDQIAELRKEFEKIDKDGTGEISFTALKQLFRESAEAGTLGALNESEVEDIFNSLRMRKSEPTIRWHEFIAAGLSQCNFDERNLRLAFDRLDYDRKGFISYDDLAELLGSMEDKEALNQTWRDGIMECKCRMERITYQDFLRLMKGQRTELDLPNGKRRSSRSICEGSQLLEAVPEGSISPQPPRETFKFESLSPLTSLKTTNLKSSQPIERFGMPPLATPCDQETANDRPHLSPTMRFPSPLSKQGRSKSLDEQRFSEEETDVPRKRQSAFVLPSMAIEELSDVIQDESKTPLVVNRALYRKQREMRYSFLEASKEFDLKRQTSIPDLRRNGSGGLGPRMPPGSPAAGLVMRRGSTCLQNISRSNLVEEVSRSDRVEDASRRSGRPQRQRKKTMSDMSAMMK